VSKGAAPTTPSAVASRGGIDDPWRDGVHEDAVRGISLTAVATTAVMPALPTEYAESLSCGIETDPRTVSGTSSRLTQARLSDQVLPFTRWREVGGLLLAGTMKRRHGNRP
jgi:hypothetical protein